MKYNNYHTTKNTKTTLSNKLEILGLPKKTIVLVEDNIFIARVLKVKFERKGHTVYIISKGADLKSAVISHNPDCIILDIGLPDTNGISLFKELKSYYCDYVLFFTGRDTSDIEIKCFELGANDFISKRKNWDVLYERFNHLFDQNNSNETYKMAIKNFALDKKNLLCTYRQQIIPLSNDEMELLFYLLLYPDKTISRKELYWELKGINYIKSNKSIDTCLYRLRYKLIQAGVHKKVITTTRNLGFKLNRKLFE